MERKHSFLENEYYHIFSRGVEKRVMFVDTADHDRFLLLLLLANRPGSISFKNIQQKYRGESSEKIFELEAGDERLIEIISFTLMPNHFHLIVREKGAGNLSRFMLKLLTAYSMYFNTRYERSGPLFTRPFRSRHIDSDEYLRWVLAYVLLNPLELQQTDWKETGLRDADAASRFLSTYRYSSYPDLREHSRVESSILSREALPFDMGDLQNVDTLLSLLAEREAVSV